MPGIKSNKILAILFILVTGYSCSVEKNTNLSRFFHNLTSHYNIYFNCYQSYEEGVLKISESAREDYSTIMPVFLYSDPENTAPGSSFMDVAIRKASKLISLHSMTARPEGKNNNRPASEKEQEFNSRKEYNNWVDDSYLLMGKAQVYKNDYEAARITLMHNIRESIDPDIQAESTIWLSKAYVGQNNFVEARRLLSEMNITSLSQALQTEYWLTLTDIEVRQDNLEKAAQDHSKALAKMPANFNRSRYTYILARITEETGNASEAGNLYREVLRLKPPYEMEFNARINQAGVFDVATGDADEMKKGLEKLLKDAKNREYHDQIYFALGNLEMREGNTEEAINYYHKSAAASTVNNNQKGRSYLVLAEYYFNIPDYLKAQVYYDSAVISLDNSYPGYSDFYDRSLNLNELAGYLSVVEREDSLQYVASLPAPQRESMINGIIRQIEQEERNAEIQLDDRYNMGQFYENERRARTTTEMSGKWYFYNQAALTFGRSEFRNRWGQRPLEDNWRRANKSRTAAGGQTEGQGQVPTDTVSNSLNPKSPEYYLKDLPLTDSLVEISNDKIATALFNAGRVFRERLNDKARSGETYSELLSRYPNNPLVPEVLYNLYNMTKDTDPAQAQRYRDRLINGYPDSEFTLILVNPEYLQMKQKAAERAETLYDRAYDAWQGNDTALVVSICDSALIEFPGHEITPRFMLLKAYAMGPGIGERELKEQLTAITGKFPDTEEARRASELIDYLNASVPELKIEEEKQIAGEIYTVDTSGPHFFILVIKNKSLDVNRLTFDVINYNIDNYTNENYSTRGELIDDDHIRISVGPLPDYETALAYYSLFDPGKILMNTGGAEVLKFLISPANLETLNRDRNPDRYRLFFMENYKPDNNPGQ